jgi:hypothetical protein
MELNAPKSLGERLQRGLVALAVAEEMKRESG